MTASSTTTHGSAARIALIGDTHDTIVGSQIFDRLRPELTGVDLILHCGDLSSRESLDVLSAIAPVVAVRSPSDPEPEPPMLVEGPLRVVAADGWRIELRNQLAEEEIVPRDDVDVVVYSAHQPHLLAAGTTVYVSPGSPALSKSPSIAELDLTGDSPGVRFRLLDIERENPAG